MQNNDDEIYSREIKENYDAIENLKKLIPLGVLTMMAFSFVYPLIPGRRSKESLADSIGYPYAVIAMLILSGLIYFFSYKVAVKKRMKKINGLKSKIEATKEE
jgi:hypothetical protein